MRRYIMITLSIASLAFLAGCSSISDLGPSGGGSIWRSDDNGQTWEVKNKTGSQKVLPALDVLSIAFSPTDRNRILFGTRSHGIVKTDDGGESFESTNFTLPKVYGLLIDPKDPNIIYASGVLRKRGKIYKTTDDGKNWKEIYTGPADGPLVIFLLMDRRDSRIIYASTSDNQVIKTFDGGETWKNLWVSPSPAVRIVSDRSESRLIYLLTLNNKLYRSRDGGESFEDITKKVFESSGTRGNFGFLESDPSAVNSIFIGGQMGILRSRDAGETWQKIETLNNPKNFPVTAFAVNPADPSEIIASVSQATYRSTDGGTTWATNQFSSSKSIKFLRYSPLDPSIIYLGFKN